MRKSILRLVILFAVMIGAFIENAQSAHFSYVAGEFSAVCEVYAQDAYLLDGPYSAGRNQKSSTFVEEEALVFQANSLARCNIQSGFFDNSLHIQASSFASAISLDIAGYAYGVAGGSTSSEDTLGIFYKIEPDSGEMLGDNVIVYFTGAVSIEPMGRSPRGDVRALLTGAGEMDHMAITKGQLPPVTTAPDAAYEIWTEQNIVLNNTSHYGFEKVHRFNAQIGDVIGLFITTGASNECLGYESGTIISNLMITFTVERVRAGDLDGDGDVDLQDFAQFADNWLAGT